jgi:hypothetical protein
MRKAIKQSPVFKGHIFCCQRRPLNTGLTVVTFLQDHPFCNEKVALLEGGLLRIFRGTYSTHSAS